MSLPVISIAQMREWEKASWAAGKSEDEVIRKVGEIIAQKVIRSTSAGTTILILAGKGHNGDDARWAGRGISHHRIELFDVTDPETDLAKLDTLLQLRPALIIDGLFGIGINRPLDAAWIKFIERVNASKLRVLAVDVPSGLNANTGEPKGAAIEAALTLTVGAPKIGMLQPHAARYVGKLIVAEDTGLIDCPHRSELNWTIADDFFGFPPRRPVAGHKGTFGHLAILAGSLGYHGAAVLASRGAQRAQPGLVTLFTQENIYVPVASQLQAVMVHPWSPKTELPGKFSGVLVGPGLAAPDLSDELKNTVRTLWREASVPVVVDASALSWLTAATFPENAIRVITPHPGEAARLLNIATAEVQNDRVGSLRKLSRQLGNCWVVLKGHQTLIGRSDGDIFVNSSGNPYLGQGGSGDVLSGFLAAQLAQPILQGNPGRTIRYAVWRHGTTADWLTDTHQNWIIEDLLNVIGVGRVA